MKNQRTIIPVCALLASLSFASDMLGQQTNDPIESRIEALRRRVETSVKPGAVILDQSAGGVAQQAAPQIPIPQTQPSNKPEPVAAPPAKAEIPLGGAVAPVAPAVGTPDNTIASEATPEADPVAKGEKVWTLDPRSELPAAQIKSDGLEKVMVSMQRGFLIAGYADEAAETAQRALWTMRVPINIPIMHRSRQLALTPELVVKAKEVAARVAALSKRSAELTAEATAILKEWNQVIEAGSPTQVIDVDSPSLTTNQGGEINRGERQEGFEPGKGVSFKVE
jgi:hypothetical protein